MSRSRPTATLVAKIKRAAKQAARDNPSISHSEALEDGARSAGYPSWHELEQAASARGRAVVERDRPLSKLAMAILRVAAAAPNPVFLASLADELRGPLPSRADLLTALQQLVDAGIVARTSASEESFSVDFVDIELPVDPQLPPDFDDTPNEDRSPEQIDEWWDRPYAIRHPDGYSVRCLDGGAWDRSTSYGFATDLPAAKRLAAGRLAYWRSAMNTPTALYDGNGKLSIALQPRRPGEGFRILKECKDSEEAGRFIREYTGELGH